MVTTLTLYVVLWMSRSISEINARCLKFVKTCTNVIIITLFYTNCTCGLAKTELRLYLNRAKKFLLGEGRGPRGPLLNTPMSGGRKSPQRRPGAEPRWWFGEEKSV